MALKVYIAGKVSGEPLAQCTMKFGAAQKLIESQGHVAFNPLQLVNDFKMPWHMAMRICLASLASCDAIYALPCSLDSSGALIELQIARMLKIPLFKIEKK